MGFFPVPIRPVALPPPNEFNGSTSYIRFAASPSQDLSAQTALAYIYRHSVGETAGRIFHFGNSGVSALLFLLSGSGTPQFNGNSSGLATAPQRVSGVTVPVNAWTHIAATWDGGLLASGIALYTGANGRPLTLSAGDSTTNGSGSVLGTAGNQIYIGNRAENDRTFDGAIAYIARWNRVLSSGELIGAQQYGPLSVPSGLVLCWAGDRDFGPYGLRPDARDAVSSSASPQNTRLGLAQVDASRAAIAPIFSKARFDDSHQIIGGPL